MFECLGFYFVCVAVKILDSGVCVGRRILVVI